MEWRARSHNESNITGKWLHQNELQNSIGNRFVWVRRGKNQKSQKILTDSSLLGSQLVKVRISWGSRVSGDRELAIERTGILNKEYIRNVDCGIHVKMACSTK